MKVGIIRCQQTEDMCPGTTDFTMAKQGQGAFAETGAADIVGFLSCGGCPGKKAVTRAKMMADRGAEAIFLSSCIGKGTPIGFSCPNFATMKEAMAIALGPDIRLIDWTH
nr:CGGC domain-containing protein [uncultured Anaeromusa sp.]